MRLNDMSDHDRPITGKEADKCGGMVEFDMALTASVMICGATGAVLGAILAMWGTSEIPIILATVIVFAVLSGIFGFFAPWYKPREKKRANTRAVTSMLRQTLSTALSTAWTL